MEHDQLKGIVESLIFVSDEPLSPKDIAAMMGDVEESEIQSVMEALMADYEVDSKGLAIRKIAGGYQIYTRTICHPWIQKLFDEKRSRKLSESAMETLAIIVYKQPITIPELNQIRGIQSQAVVKTLLIKKLIVVRGKKKVIGRPRMYGTSEGFLIKFGLNDLKDLPPVEEFGEFLDMKGTGEAVRTGDPDQTAEGEAFSEEEGTDHADAGSEDHLDDGHHFTAQSGEPSD